MERESRVAIVLSHWQNYEITRDCLRSMSVLDYPTYSVVVVDDGSTNGSGKRLQEEFPQHHFILLPENKGLAAATNHGFKYALGTEADYLLWINNDVIFIKADFLSRMVAFLEEHPTVGATGPKILSPDGTHQKSYKRSFESLAVDMWGVGTIEKIIGDIFFKKNNEVIRPTAWLVGVSLLIRRRALEQAGLMDEDFPFGGEDADLLFRIAKHGWGIYYYPLTEIVHLGSMSHKETSSKYHRFYVESPLRFFYKNYSPAKAWILQYLLIGAFVWRGCIYWCLSLIKNSYRQKVKPAFEGARIAWSFRWPS